MRTLSEAAKAAKMIRTELKLAFPNIKFTVTSSNYSMGNSVSVRWQDFPFCNAVKAITDKYQYGSFDSDTESYEIDNSRKDLPQTKYILLMFSKKEATL